MPTVPRDIRSTNITLFHKMVRDKAGDTLCTISFPQAATEGPVLIRSPTIAIERADFYCV